MEYIERVLTNLKAKNADQPEFIQAVEEVLESLEPVIKSSSWIWRYGYFRKINWTGKNFNV